MKSRLILLIHACTAFILFASGARAQPPRDEILAGCFELKLGPWTPTLGGAAPFSTPPDTVQLFADSNYDHPQPGWKRASPPIRHRYSGGRERATWTLLDSTSFRVIWSDGLLERTFGSLEVPPVTGLVRMLSDAIGPEELTPRATVVAKRVTCNR